MFLIGLMLGVVFRWNPQRTLTALIVGDVLILLPTPALVWGGWVFTVAFLCLSVGIVMMGTGIGAMFRRAVLRNP